MISFKFKGTGRTAKQGLVNAKRPNPKTKSMDGEYAWQDDLIDPMVAEQLSLLVSPTGSGKTTIIGVVAKLREALGQRALIAAPRQDIASGFTPEYKVKRKDGNEPIPIFVAPKYRYFGTVENTQSADVDSGIIKSLKDFLMKVHRKDMAVPGEPSWCLDEGVAVTTHAALARVWEEMTEEERDKASTNIWIAIDEAHHIRGAQPSEYDPDYIANDYANRLGGIVGHIQDKSKKDKSVGLCLVSATFFRMDSFIVNTDSFKTFERKFLDHWKFLELENFHYDCVGYENDPLETIIDQIQREKDRVHIINVPSQGKKFRESDSDDNPAWINKLITELKKIGLTPLDLVSKDVQHNNKNILRRANEEYPSKPFPYDVIIACEMMREGTDCVPASRVHDFVPSPNPGRTCQTTGRMLRKDQNKKDVAYIVYFKNLEQHADKESTRAKVADFVNVGVAGMMAIHDMFDPFIITWSDGTKSTITEKSEDGTLGKKKGLPESENKPNLKKLEVDVCIAREEMLDTGEITHGMSVEQQTIKILKRIDISSYDNIRDVRKYVGGYIIRLNSISPPIPRKASDIRLKGNIDIVERSNGPRLFEALLGNQEFKDIYDFVVNRKPKAQQRIIDAMTNPKGKAHRKARANIKKKKKKKVGLSKADNIIVASGSERDD